ncbi:MAG: YkgJ family cysteine cluster protein [Gammaproteobacteria bacterium]|nr:YkgJ family cysteine cluster protein [Gammaproteobacteria bacterium]
MNKPHPCLSCGACCAFYRVSFYWTEADPFNGGTIPQELVQQLTPHRVAMKGTTGKAGKSRCIALDGEVGKSVGCSIYDKRGTTCRDFAPSWESGRPNESCDKARAFYGMTPLTPEDFEAPDPQFPPLPRTA